MICSLIAHFSGERNERVSLPGIAIRIRQHYLPNSSFAGGSSRYAVALDCFGPHVVSCQRAFRGGQYYFLPTRPIYAASGEPFAVSTSIEWRMDRTAFSRIRFERGSLVGRCGSAEECHLFSAARRRRLTRTLEGQLRRRCPRPMVIGSNCTIGRRKVIGVSESS